MKDWIMELCPEIAEWQAELIVDHVERLVRHEREACAKVCDEQQELVDGEMCCVAMNCAAAIRARGDK